MLDFLAEEQASICGGSHLKRREFLQVGALSAAGLSLPQLLAAKEAGAVRPGHDNRACIMIFNLGSTQLCMGKRWISDLHGGTQNENSQSNHDFQSGIHRKVV